MTFQKGTEVNDEKMELPLSSFAFPLSRKGNIGTKRKLDYAKAGMDVC